MRSGAAGQSGGQPASSKSATAALTVESVSLPKVDSRVRLERLFYEPLNDRVWILTGDGGVNVFEVTKRIFVGVEGFQTVGGGVHPRAGTVGGGFAYISNPRAKQLCTVNLQTLRNIACLALPAEPYCVQFVTSMDEVWVTLPSYNSLLMIGVTKTGDLNLTGVVRLDGMPKSCTLDEPRGIFLTNLEGSDATLGVDVRSHEQKWSLRDGCGGEGARDLAVDSGRGILLIACADRVRSLDLLHRGSFLAQLDTGAGLEELAYDPHTALLYAAAGQAERLTVARLNDRGELTPVAIGDTPPGARNAIADAKGTIYVGDPRAPRILLFHKPRP